MTSEGLRLLYQDQQLLVVHKPAGWTIYAEDGVPKEEHLLNVCQNLFDAKLFPVHRLDRVTCGIVVFATDGRWAREMQEQFAGRKIIKRYLALVSGKVAKKQTIDIALKEKGKSEQNALTEIIPKKILSHGQALVSLVDLFPKTGRFHQLRKHCKLIGHPIIGDKLYGGPAEKRLMLSAVELRFRQPKNKKDLVITDTPDEDFNEILKSFR